MDQNNSNNELLYVNPGVQSLQNNLNGYRNGSKMTSRRQLQGLGMPMKYWPNGRPRGSLERFSSTKKYRSIKHEEQGLSAGIQGTSIQRKHRFGTSIEDNHPVNRSQDKAKIKTMSNEQILSAIEKLSQKFGTPFVLKGHKEEFARQITSNEELKDTLLNYNHHKSNHSHFSVPSSGSKMRPVLTSKNPFHNISVKQSSTISTVPSILPLTDAVPNKKYLLSYMNAKEAEKEKIINLFSKLFREFHFNKKEDKDLILRHIRKLYPSALYLSGKKIDNLLKAFMVNK